MGKLIDKICKCRDLLVYSPQKLRGYMGDGALFDSTIQDIHHQLSKKSADYSHKLEFTSQDLMEFAYDIQKVLKDWEKEMSPSRNVQQLLKTVKDGKLNLDEFTSQKTEVMALRRDCIKTLMTSLSVLEYHSVFLYFLEEASKDEFAITYTRRF